MKNINHEVLEKELTLARESLKKAQSVEESNAFIELIEEIVNKLNNLSHSNIENSPGTIKKSHL